MRPEFHDLIDQSQGCDCRHSIDVHQGLSRIPGGCAVSGCPCPKKWTQVMESALDVIIAQVEDEAYRWAIRDIEATRD